MSLVEDLVRRPAIRHRNGVGFLILRSWRASCRDADLAAFKAEKRAKTPAVLDAAAAEIAESKAADRSQRRMGVTCVACAGNIKFAKHKSVGRIEGAVAVAMAIGRALANDGGPTIYERARPEGFLFV